MLQTDITTHLSYLLQTAILAAMKAGNAIMTVYNNHSYSVALKSDNSPLTTADRNAHQIIYQVLTSTKIPILSEEGENIPYNSRKNWDMLWIVDPLDGTKEFIKHNDEFTVNIALIQNQRPIMGIVFCPPQRTIYFAAEYLKGAFKAIVSIDSMVDVAEIMANSKKLPLFQSSDCLTIVASRSHLNDETIDFISKLDVKNGETKLVSKGSSLKFCLVAEGLADIYPRFAPTCEWDTAAAQAIVEFAGGSVVDAVTNSPLSYNKQNLLNPSFVVKRK